MSGGELKNMTSMPELYQTRKPRVLVTGATGFIGTNLLRRIHGRYNTGVFIRKTSDTSRIDGLFSEKFIGDLRDAGAVENAVKWADVVVHSAALLRSDDGNASAEVNVAGTKNVVDACTKHGIKNIVYISTVNVLAGKKGPYARTKEEAEKLVLASGLDAKVVRPTFVYGRGSKEFERMIKITGRRFVPLINGGKNKIQPAYIDDVVETIENAMNAPAGVYNVAGSVPITFKDFFRMLGRAQNRRNIFINIPLRVFFLFNLMLRVLTDEQTLVFSQDRVLDTSKTERELGLKITPYEEGIKRSLL